MSERLSTGETAPTASLVERPDFTKLQFRHDGPWLIRLLDPCRTFTPGMLHLVYGAVGVWALFEVATMLAANIPRHYSLSGCLAALLLPGNVFLIGGFGRRRETWFRMSWRDPLLIPLIASSLGLCAVGTFAMWSSANPGIDGIYGLAGLPFLIVRSRLFSPRVPQSDIEHIERWLEQQNAACASVKWQ